MMWTDLFIFWVLWCILTKTQISSLFQIRQSWHHGNSPLQWRHNGRDSVSNHQPPDCLLNPLFRRGSKKTPKLPMTGLCVGNSPWTGEFPAQMASNAESISVWWRHLATSVFVLGQPHFRTVPNMKSHLGQSHIRTFVRWLLIWLITVILTWKICWRKCPSLLHKMLRCHVPIICHVYVAID